MKLKKGDKIKVITGKDKGKEGVIDRVYKKSEKVLVQGVNIYKKHVKKSEQMPQGGIIDLPRPLATAKVMFVCPKCNKSVRVGYKSEKDKKVRFCKKCNAVI